MYWMTWKMSLQAVEAWDLVRWTAGCTLNKYLGTSMSMTQCCTGAAVPQARAPKIGPCLNMWETTSKTHNLSLSARKNDQVPDPWPQATPLLGLGTREEEQYSTIDDSSASLAQENSSKQQQCGPHCQWQGRSNGRCWHWLELDWSSVWTKWRQFQWQFDQRWPKARLLELTGYGSCRVSGCSKHVD